MNISLSLDNVTHAEASLIFSALANGLTKPVLPTDAEIKKAVKNAIQTTAIKEETPAPQPEPEEEIVTPVNEPKKTKKKIPVVVQPEPEEPEETEEPEEIAEAITVDTLKARAHKLVKADKANSPKIVALLKKAGVDSIPKLKPELYAGFNKALDKLIAYQS